MKALALSMLCLLFSVSCLALDAGLSDGQGLSREPVHVRADSLQAESGLNQVVFLGNVVATQGDLVIYAD